MHCKEYLVFLHGLHINAHIFLCVGQLYLRFVIRTNFSFSDSNIYELSQPQDLLVHFPMWSVSQPVGNVDDSSELGQVQYEVEVPTDGSLTYPHSPGSTGDNSDYSSGISLFLLLTFLH